MSKRFIIVFFIGFLGLGQYSYSQEIDKDAKSPKTQSSSKRQKEAEKKQEKRRKAADKAEKQLRKDHIKIQDKAVKKRMKKSRKEADRINSGKKEFFLKRWFSKKHR